MIEIGKRIGFTGTRQGMTETQSGAVLELLRALTPSEFHHGDCIGADATAHDLAKSLSIFVVAHPPSDSRYRAWRSRTADVVIREAPYLQRNHEIVHATDLVIATPKTLVEEWRGSGTWATIRYARGIRRVWIISPDGEVIP